MNVIIDTNIYLRFYHFSKEDLDELKKIERLIDIDKITLYITPQIRREFARNREGKINDALRKLTELKFNANIPRLCTGYDEVAEIQKALKTASKMHSQLLTKLNTAIKEEQLQADELIRGLFAKATEIKETRSLLHKARLRQMLGEPPGKRDSFGDQINWESILSADFGFQSLSILAADSDYASAIDQDTIHPVLRKEYEERHVETVELFTQLTTFFAAKFPDIKLDDDIERNFLIADLANSGSFSRTHTIVGQLLKDSNFSANQRKQILEYSMQNTQVSWLIKDDDVSLLLKTVVDGHEGIFDKKDIERYKEAIK